MPPGSRLPLLLQHNTAPDPMVATGLPQGQGGMEPRMGSRQANMGNRQVLQEVLQVLLLLQEHTEPLRRDTGQQRRLPMRHGAGTDSTEALPPDSTRLARRRVPGLRMGRQGQGPGLRLGGTVSTVAVSTEGLQVLLERLVALVCLLLTPPRDSMEPCPHRLLLVLLVGGQVRRRSDFWTPGVQHLLC